MLTPARLNPARSSGLAVALGIGLGMLAGAPAAAAAPADTAGRVSADQTDQTTTAQSRGQRADRAAGPGARNHPVSRPSARASAATVTRPARARAATAPDAPVTQRARPVEPVRATPAERIAQPESPAGPTTPVAASTGVSDTVSVDLPPLPVDHGWSFEVSPDLITDYATAYVDGGGDPADSPRFFFGDLAVASLEALAEQDLSPEQIRLELGNLVVSGYFGGIWLRDNLRAAPEAEVTGIAAPPSQIAAVSGASAGAVAGRPNLASALTIRLFGLVAGTLTAAGASRPPFIVRVANHVSVPVLLALYGYNRGYLEVVLDNPPPGVPSMKDTLQCEGFLDCDSTAFPLEIADRYDAALGDLAHPTNLRWWEMKAWTALLEGATGAGRFVWEIIASQGFSPTSYVPLVDLSSAYLMISKAAVLSSMLGYANGDTETGRSSLRLQAGLWLWSGSYFAGLASNAPPGTIPTIVVN